VQEIAPALGMSAVAAYRWLKAGGPPTHDKPAQPRPLDPYVPHLEAPGARGAATAGGSGGKCGRWASPAR